MKRLFLIFGFLSFIFLEADELRLSESTFIGQSKSSSDKKKFIIRPSEKAIKLTKFKDWKVTLNGEGASKTIDGDPVSYEEVSKPEYQHELIIDLGTLHRVQALSILYFLHHEAEDLEVFVSRKPDFPEKAVLAGKITELETVSELESRVNFLKFPKTHVARYIKVKFSKAFRRENLRITELAIVSSGYFVDSKGLMDEERLAKYQQGLFVDFDNQAGPAVQKNCDALKKTAINYYPRLYELMYGYKLSSTFKVKMEMKDFDGVAYAGSKIVYSSRFYRGKSSKESLGVAVHELAHFLQQYSVNSRLYHGNTFHVEGIADYSTYYDFGPIYTDGLGKSKLFNHTQINPRHNYLNGYWGGADFLAYLASTYDQKLIPKLNYLIARKEFKGDESYMDILGKTVKELWAEAILKAASGKARPVNNKWLLSAELQGKSLPSVSRWQVEKAFPKNNSWKGIDNDLTTVWESEKHKTQPVALHNFVFSVPKALKFNRVVIVPEVLAGEKALLTLAKVSLSADGKKWFASKSFENEFVDKSKSKLEFDFNSTKAAKYFRVYLKTNLAEHQPIGIKDIYLTTTKATYSGMNAVKGNDFSFLEAKEANWQVIKAEPKSRQNEELLIDNDLRSDWTVRFGEDDQEAAASIEIDLKKLERMNGVFIASGYDLNRETGAIDSLKLEISEDNKTWIEAIPEGALTYTSYNKFIHKILFPKSQKARYLRFKLKVDAKTIKGTSLRVRELGIVQHNQLVTAKGLFSPANNYGEYNEDYVEAQFAIESRQLEDFSWVREKRLKLKELLPTAFKKIYTEQSKAPASRRAYVYFSPKEQAAISEYGTELPIDLAKANDLAVFQSTLVSSLAYEGAPDWLSYSLAALLTLETYKIPVQSLDKSLEPYDKNLSTAILFLDKIRANHDPNFLVKLHAKLNGQKYQESVFKELTQLDLKELWKKYK